MDAIDPNLLTSASGNEGVIVPAEGEFGRGFWGWWYFCLLYTSRCV